MDFLDRFGEQLHRAGQRRRRRRLTRASLLVPAVAVAAAVFALPTADDIERPAARQPVPTGTWSPELGRPALGLDASIDRSPVSRDASAVLGVLRRAQTARDRRLAKPRLKHAGGIVDDVQVDGVRALSQDYALVPVLQIGGRREPTLCVMGGGGSACGPISHVREHGVSSLSGGPKGTHVVGVVPDGVTRVRFTPDGGNPTDSIVRRNFYDIRVPESSPAGRVQPPEEYAGPTGKDGKIPGPGGPASGTLEWFDASGNIIKRTRS
jgi:hypothetical protein